LETGDERIGGLDRVHLTILDVTTVGGANGTSRSNHLVRSSEKRFDGSEQPVTVDKRVRIERTEKRRVGKPNPGVQRVAFPPVVLVDDDQFVYDRRPIDSLDRCGIDIEGQFGVDFPEIERVDESFEGRVGRTIVDDDEFLRPVFQVNECLDAIDDRRCFVVRRNDDGDCREKRTSEAIERGCPATLANAVAQFQ
jgi:hypothetical protein